MKQRNIITKKDVKNYKKKEETNQNLLQAQPTPTSDDFFDRLMNYVPVEIIGGYIIIDGALKSLMSTENQRIALLSLLILGIIGTFYYVKKYLKIIRFTQIFMSALAFVVWVFTIGGWFGTYEYWQPLWGTIAVVIYAVAVKIMTLEPLP